MSTEKKILGNTAVQFAGRATMAVLSVVILKSITGFLGVEGYGMYTAIYEFLAFFAIVADLGLFTIAVREMGKGSHSRDFIVGNIFGMRILLSVTAMLLAILVAFLIPQYADTFIPIGVLIASLGVFFNLMHGTVSSILQVELKMQYATIGLVAGKVINLLWILAMVFYFYVGNPGAAAFYSLIVAGTIGNFFSFLYTLYYSAKYEKIVPRFDKEYWKEIIFTAAPYGLALILNMIYFRIDSIMILLMKGPEELGFYGPAVRVLEILSVISVYFMNSVLPSLSQYVKEGGDRLKNLLRFAFDFLFMSALPVLLGVFLLASPLVTLITGPEFLGDPAAGIFGSDAALQILVFASFFAFVTNLFTYSLVAVNKQWHLLWINGMASILNIVANLFFIERWGFRGAAMTSVATEAFIFLITWFVARQFLRYSFDWPAIVKTIFAATIMGGLVYLLLPFGLSVAGSVSILPIGALGAVVYFAILWLSGAISDEFKILFKR